MKHKILIREYISWSKSSIVYLPKDAELLTVEKTKSNSEPIIVYLAINDSESLRDLVAVRFTYLNISDVLRFPNLKYLGVIRGESGERRGFNEDYYWFYGPADA